ncbi:AAA family ATPase [Desulfonatronum parangueonense]
MYISRIRLRNWKNFGDAATPLSWRTFLIGPNASGKSNLLDALRFLRELAIDGLAPAVGRRGGISSLRCLSARRYSDIDIDVKLADDSGTDVWQYCIVINQDNRQRPIVKKELVYNLKNSSVALDRPGPEDGNDPERLTQTDLEQVIANKEFREISDYFKTISYQHIVPQVVRDPQGFTSMPVHDDPFGRDFLLRLWNTQKKTRTARLKRIAAALKVAVPKLQELDIVMDKQGTPHLIGRYEHWRAQGAFQNESQLSDGTLRLFSLLWTVFEGNGALLLEEPELSLHSEVVRYLPQLFERLQKLRKNRRQIILSTHSEEILQDKGIGGEEIVRLEIGENGTTFQPPDENENLLLRQGLSVAEVLLPRTAPPRAHQLSLFAE